MTPPAAPDDRAEPPAGPVLRAAGVLVGSLGAVVLAVLSGVLVPLRAGTTRLPVSLVIALLGGFAVVHFTRRATGSRLLPLVPVVVWFVVVGVLGTRTREGDLVLVSGDAVALGTLLLGAVGLVAGIWVGTVRHR